MRCPKTSRVHFRFPIIGCWTNIFKLLVPYCTSYVTKITAHLILTFVTFQFYPVPYGQFHPILYGILFQLEHLYFSNDFLIFSNAVTYILDVRLCRNITSPYFFIKLNFCSTLIFRAAKYLDFIFPYLLQWLDY